MDIEHSIIVQNSLNEVVQKLHNFQNHKEIIDITNTFYQTSKTKIDTQYTKVIHVLGNNWKNNLEVILLIPNKIITVKSIYGTLPIEESFMVKENKEGICIKWQVHIQPKGLSKILSPIIKNNVSRQIRYRILDLKEKLDFDFMQQTNLAFAIQNNRYWL